MKVAKKVFFIALMIWTVLMVKIYASTGTADKYNAIVLREEASTSSEPLAEIRRGQTVEIVEKTGNWYKVNFDGKTGYVREDLLTVEETVANPETPAEQEPAPEENKEEPVQEEEAKQEEVKEEEKTESEEQTTTVEETQPVEEKKENTINPIGEKKVTADTVSRIVPNISASKLEDVKEGTVVTVIKVLNSWSCIKYDNNKTAWILTSFLTSVEAEGEETSTETVTETTTEPTEYTQRTGYINVSAAIIRQGPSTSAGIVTEKYRNNAVEIIGEDGDWYKVRVDGQEAYVAKRLVSDSVSTENASRNVVERTQQEVEEQETQPVQEETKTETSKTETSTEGATKAVEATPAPTPEPAPAPAASSRGDEVAAVAQQYLGCSYTYGGSGPSTFDCSGFTMYVFSQFGVSLAHGAISQSNAGTYVAKGDLMPGDLVIFRDWDNASIGHCGIYIGGGRFIHAANPKRGVVTDTLNSGYYYERYVTGRRLV